MLAEPHTDNGRISPLAPFGLPDCTAGAHTNADKGEDGHRPVP